jgi:hypothetical protein
MRANPETVRVRKDRPISAAVVAAGLGLSAVLTGCGSAGAQPPRATIESVWNPPSGSDVVFHGNITDEGGNWPMDCYSDHPNDPRTATAERGDTILTLAHRAGTLLIQSPSLRGRNIPPDVFAAPLAEMNNLDDPDLILEGRTYIFPDICHLGEVG